MKISKNIMAIIWAYLGEMILTSLVYGLALILWDYNKLADIVIKMSDGLSSKFTAIMFAGGIAFFWSFYQHSNTNFAKWLHEKNAFNTYLKAFLYAIAIFLFATIALVVTQATKSRFIAAIAGWLFALAMINMVTFIWNIVGLMRLNIIFNIEFDKKKKN